ncbi:MAG: hypothetical protein VX026_10450, partial [Myxococcota bacterium]|nr:hypothetical protein [Myxococcota bacterium]
MSILFFTLMGCLVRSEKDQNGADQSDNAQPVIESVLITPETGVFIGTSLTCYAVVTDEEDGSFEPSYEWRVNGVSVGDSPGFTVTSESGATVNSSIQCVATATDSGGRSVTLSSEVRLENTDPVIAAIDIDADTGPDVYNTSILTCQIEADDPNQTELTDIEYTWKVIGETEETLANTANIDLSDFEISPETDIKCEVLVTDDHSGFATASASVKVSNRAPEFIEPPSLTWTPTNGEGPEANAVVNCVTDAIDPDGEEPTVVRSWLL